MYVCYQEPGVWSQHDPQAPGLLSDGGTDCPGDRSPTNTASSKWCPHLSRQHNALGSMHSMLPSDTLGYMDPQTVRERIIASDLI